MLTTMQVIQPTSWQLKFFLKNTIYLQLFLMYKLRETAWSHWKRVTVKARQSLSRWLT